MANKAAAKKYYRASQRRRMRNKPVRTRARTSVRDAIEAIAEGDWTEADAAVAAAVSALDRAAQKGVIHANSAARRKSRLLRRYHTARNPERAAMPHRRPPDPATIAG